MANWLNSTFSAFDSAIFSVVNSIACKFLTSLSVFFTFIGESGIIYFILAFILILFKKTRRAGLAIFGAVSCGYLVSNLIIKGLVARERPYIADSVFYQYFMEVGSHIENGYSFPSGHATSVFAFATMFFFYFDKKYSFVGFIFGLIMCFSRIYLIAHYPTDVIAGIVVGTLSAFIAEAVVIFIYFICNKYNQVGLFNFWLEFDIKNLFKKDK